MQAVRKQLGPEGRERTEAGKYTVTEAARFLKKHRNWLVRRIERGDVPVDEQGFIDESELASLEDAIGEEASDPAVEHLKKGFEVLVSHSEVMFGKYVAAIDGVLQLQAATIRDLGKQLGEANQAQVDVYRAHREIMLAKDESAAAAAAIRQDADAKQGFLDLAKGAVSSTLFDRSLAAKFKGIMGRLNDRALAAMAEHINPGDLAELLKVSEMLEQVTTTPAADEAA